VEGLLYPSRLFFHLLIFASIVCVSGKEMNAGTVNVASENRALDFFAPYSFQEEILSRSETPASTINASNEREGGEMHSTFLQKEPRREQKEPFVTDRLGPPTTFLSRGLSNADESRAERSLVQFVADFRHYRDGTRFFSFHHLKGMNEVVENGYFNLLNET
jgi:hypothetical protein